MPVPCETCDGYGQVISDRSVRAGHTHGNDPDREDVACEDCEGAGERDATASDLDGALVQYKWMVGYVTYERANDSLTLCDDNAIEIVNLQPKDVELI